MDLSTDVPHVEGLRIEIQPPATLALSGMITKKEPSQDLAGFFRSIHRHAMAHGLTELQIDIRQLTFVNSSAIRLFIDWAMWVKAEPSHAYTLRFLTSRRYTWQATAFTALLSLMRDVLTVERFD